ncbi:TonB-dependent receptor plug domain-containing protein [Litorimonas sp. RW-G-Af-16]|uniref:TonB-dependent receptor plug domain-containing protein n=1 Tax=Litorimonas sp. RW-G-Af-16 TaxID=3241168 RepID=UPI00390C94CC
MEIDMFFKRFLLSSAVIASATSPVFAQDADVDEIIVTSLRAIPASDVTSSISILNEADLAIRNSPYFVDQLRAIPSVGVSRSGAVGAITQVRIRGAEGNHTLVLLNGVEVSDPTIGETDFSLWSGLNTQRVEVARGEQSVLYGSDSIGGVISITTGGEGISGAIEYGSFDTLRGQFGINKQIEGLSFGLNAAGFKTDGVDIAGLDGEKDGSESYSISGNAELEITPDWSISGFSSLRRSDSQTDPDTNFDGLLDNANRFRRADQFIAAASINGQTGVVNHIARANFNELVADNFAEDVFTNQVTGQRTKLLYSPSVSFGDTNQNVTLSGLVDWESTNYQRKDTNTAFGDPNQSQTFETLGIAAEARARLGAIALNGSVRHDDNDGRFEDATTWRVGGAYNFDFGGKLRASTGAGVTNPSFTEIFGFFPGSFVGNPELVPEKSKSWEVGYDHNFGNVEASISYFDASLENEIFTAFGFPTSTADNREGESERSGIEASLGWQVSDTLNISAAASKISSENDSEEDEIRVPEFTASAAINWQSSTKDGLRAGLAADYVGSQDDFNFGSFPAERVALDSYVLVSATAEYPLNDRLSVTVRGENLLDETTVDVFGYNGTGAGVFVGFKIR